MPKGLKQRISFSTSTNANGKASIFDLRLNMFTASSSLSYRYAVSPFQKPHDYTNQTCSKLRRIMTGTAGRLSPYKTMRQSLNVQFPRTFQQITYSIINIRDHYDDEGNNFYRSTGGVVALTKLCKVTNNIAH